MRLRNKTREMGGDVDRAREVLAAEAAADEARKAKQVEDAKHAAAMNQRIRDNQVQAARMAGRIV